MLCLFTQVWAQLTNYSILRSFGRSDSPPRELSERDDGSLCGSTGGSATSFGTVFKVKKDGTGYTTLRRFTAFVNADGAEPQGRLLRASDGVLYGTTTTGGTNLAGTVFKLNQDGSGYAVLRRFTGTAADGNGPSDGLIEGNDGMLYGTTTRGGINDCGTVFKLSKDGSSYLILYRFTGVNGDGREPEAGLIEGSDGALYGTTRLGGVAPFGRDFGTVFKVNKDGTGYTVLHRFDGNAGWGPTARLLEGSNGGLYGTTVYGGANNDGTVFKLEKNGSGFSVLHEFDAVGGDGEQPTGGLIECRDGALYGTTWLGGTNFGGTLFKLNKDGTGYSLLHRFSDSPGDGRNPVETLFEGSDGALYGTTSGGGAFESGTIFRLGHALSLARFSDNATLGLTGIPGFTYQLQRSSDLETWIPLKTVVLSQNSVASFEDTNAPPGAAFYRLHVP